MNILPAPTKDQSVLDDTYNLKTNASRSTLQSKNYSIDLKGKLSRKFEQENSIHNRITFLQNQEAMKLRKLRNSYIEA